MSDLRFPRRMGPVDAMFWRLEREPTLRSTGLAVSILDAPPERDALRAALRRASRRIPRLRQRVVELPLLATPIWVEAPDFTLDDHLQWLGAPGKGELQDVLDLAAAMAMRPFDRARPLWEFALVERLADGRAALVQKLHHAIGDGAAGVALLGEIFDLSRDARREPVAERETDRRSGESLPEAAAEAFASDLVALPRAAVGALSDGLAAAAEPLETARRVRDEALAVGGIMRSGPGPLSPLLRERSGRSRLAAFVVPDEVLAAAGRAGGCSFHDALLAAVTGGLARYHERHGAPVEALRAAIPISIRGDDDASTVGNRLSIGRFEVPVAERDPRRRMQALRARVGEQRRPASLPAFEAVATFVNLSPLSLVLPLVLEEMRKSDVVATAVRGPSQPLFLAGRRVESYLTFGPTAGAALNVTVFRYLEEAGVALTLDPAAVAEPESLVGCLEEGFEEVLRLA